MSQRRSAQRWIAFAPGMAIKLTILGLNLLGDGPEMRSIHACARDP